MQDNLKDSRARSTKTRIETVKSCHYLTFIGIREQDPLKQGLKRTDAAPFPENVVIREQDPLKQGLKRE